MLDKLVQKLISILVLLEFVHVNFLHDGQMIFFFFTCCTCKLVGEIVSSSIENSFRTSLVKNGRWESSDENFNFFLTGSIVILLYEFLGVTLEIAE